MESSQAVADPRFQRIISIDVIVGQERRPRRSFIEPSRLLIGRLPTSDILFGAKEQTVSSSHAEIIQIEGKLVLRDLDSRNGLWIPGTGDRTGTRIKELILDESEEPKDITLGPGGPLCRIYVGSVIPFSDYLVTGQLGEGGMATVFMARKAQGPERPVVLKLIAQSLLLSIDPREAKAMFEQESRLSPFVIDANVVNIFDTGCWEGTHYIAMEYLRGVNLSSVIKQLHRKGLRCPFPLAAALVSRACLGLHAAHEARDETGEPLGIVHRDFTPTNIMCTPDGEVKLIDFGVARALGKRSLVSRGQFVGKPAYAAPEQIRSPQEVDRRTDVFAAGVILYELAAGCSLFQRETDFATMDAVISAPIPTIPDAPPALMDLINKTLCRDPIGRPQTAAQLAEELERFTLSTHGELMRRGAVAQALSALGVDLVPPPARPLTARPALFPTLVHTPADIKSPASSDRVVKPRAAPARANPEAPVQLVLGEYTCQVGRQIHLHQEKTGAPLLSVCYEVQISTSSSGEVTSGRLHLYSGEQAWSSPRAESSLKISQVLEQLRPLFSNVLVEPLFAGEAWSAGPFAVLVGRSDHQQGWNAAAKRAEDTPARLSLLRQLCTSLFAACQQLPLFVHGGLSPHQLTVQTQDEQPQVLLTLGHSIDALLGLALPGATTGSEPDPYQAPDSAATSASDVFSIGMLGYELFGGDLQSACLAVSNGGLPPPIPPCVMVSPHLRDVLMESLRVSSHLRPSIAALCRALGNRTIPSPRTLLPIQVPQTEMTREVNHPDDAKLFLSTLKIDKSGVQGLRVLPFSNVPNLLPAKLGILLFRGLFAVELCHGEQSQVLGGGGHRLYGEGAISGDKRLLLLQPGGVFDIGSRSQRRLQKIEYLRVLLRPEVAVDLPQLGIRIMPEEERLAILLWTTDVRSGDHHLLCVQITE